MLAAMEGLSTNDGSATLTAFTAIPPRVSIDEINGTTAWGAEASLRMNLEDADMETLDFEFNPL